MKRKEKIEETETIETIGERGKISRRGFLKSAAGASALAAFSGAALDLTKGQADAAVRKLPTKWDEDVDVIVIGSGFAGLAAAAEAAGKGAKVVVLEKMPTYGGNSIISGGTYCAYDDKTHMRQRLNLGEDSAELHKQDTLKGGDFYNIPELVEIMVQGAVPGINWLIEEGNVRFRESINRGGGHTAYRVSKGSRGCWSGN